MKFHIELNKTPLLLAVQNSCFEMIKLLLEQPNIEIDAKDHVQKYIKQNLNTKINGFYEIYWRTPIDFANNEEIKRLFN